MNHPPPPPPLHNENDDDVVFVGTQSLSQVLAERGRKAEREGHMITIHSDDEDDDEDEDDDVPSPRIARSKYSPREVIVVDDSDDDEDDDSDELSVREETLAGPPAAAVAAPTDAQTAATAAATSSVPPVPVTPPATARKSAPETTTKQFNAALYSTDVDWIQEMANWLESGKGGQTKIMSDANARCVLKQVTKLAKGQGISYRQWPKNVCFYPNVPVDLSFDFHKMLAEAQEYEQQYGRDRGNGWLLRHPIKKLKMFKAFLQSSGSGRPVSG